MKKDGLCFEQITVSGRFRKIGSDKPIVYQKSDFSILLIYYDKCYL